MTILDAMLVLIIAYYYGMCREQRKWIEELKAQVQKNNDSSEEESIQTLEIRETNNVGQS